MSKTKLASNNGIKDELAESEARFKTLTNQSPSVIFIHDKKKIVYVNDKAVEITGYSRKEFYNPKFDFFKLILPRDRKKIRASFNAHKNDEEVDQIEHTVVTKSRKKINTILNTKLIDFKGRKVIMGVITDISAQKKAEEQIRASVEEKDAMLKEIHHRVKNNMQIISSLIRLQTQDIEDIKVLEICNEVQSRIKSMALIHDHLYHSEDLSKVDLKNYIFSLGAHLLVMHKNRSFDVQLEYDTQKIALPIVKAIPCGLIINELVSNCYKHAFPPKYIKTKPKSFVPTISVVMESGRPGIVRLRISDNGIGHSKGDGLGLVLINDLVGQIDGTLERKNDRGTSYEICFSSG